MKGRDHFTSSEADEIRRVLRLVRKAEPGTPQKLLRDQVRAIGFYISDFSGGSAGFTASGFDDLVRRGRITVGAGPPTGRATFLRSPTSETKKASPPVADQPAEASVLPTGGLNVTAALAALSTQPMSIAAATDGGVPDRPGLYALYGSPAVWKRLGLGSPPDARPLYVGKAEASLVSRDLRTHFATGKTGQSSPRRSFAALLSHAGSLDLVAVPRRRHDPEPKRWTHYALEERGDEQLTDWMRDQLLIAIWPSPARTHLATVEDAVMQKWLPPLNLIGVHTPWTSQVKAARAAMAVQAREWARERGFDV